MAKKELPVTEDMQDLWDEIEEAKHQHPERLPELRLRLAKATVAATALAPDLVHVDSRCPVCNATVTLLCAEPWFFYICFICQQVRQSGKGLMLPH